MCNETSTETESLAELLVEIPEEIVEEVLRETDRKTVNSLFKLLDQLSDENSSTNETDDKADKKKSCRKSIARKSGALVKLRIYKEGTIGNEVKRLEISRRAEFKHDKRDYCIYCREDVTNFSRHLYRNHSKESAVISIKGYPLGSKPRKRKLDALRKEGNYKLLEEKGIIRPKQRDGKFQLKSVLQEFAPCPDCLGIYHRNSLHVHIKRCPKSAKNKHENSGRKVRRAGS